MDCLWKFISAFAQARISHTLAAPLANHLAASELVLPRHITLDMPWSSSPPDDKSITQSEPPECKISGLGGQRMLGRNKDVELVVLLDRVLIMHRANETLGQEGSATFYDNGARRNSPFN